MARRGVAPEAGIGGVYGARSEPGAGHYEMYDEPEYVDAAVERLTDFYVSNL